MATTISDGRKSKRSPAGSPVARRPVARVRKDGVATRTAILIAAEVLFADFGFDGVSIRDITRASGVDLGLVNYHFKSKENLFHEVLSMRVDEMNARRLALMNDVVLREGDRACVIELFYAFTMPFSGTSPTEAKRLSNYRRLVALVANSRRWQTQVFERHYDPIAQALVAKLRLVLPKADIAAIYWSISFFLGAMVNAYAETHRVDRLSGGRCRSHDLPGLLQKLVLFSVAGLMQLAEESRK